MKDKLKKILRREEKEIDPEVKRKKTIAFFGFYLVFFIFLFIWMRSYGSNSNTNTQTDTGQTEITYKTDLIENNNYTYVYEIDENGETKTFKGIRDDENYDVSEYKYKFFLDIYNIKKLIKNSKYLYKTDNNNEISYKYEIDNKTLSNMLQDGKSIEEGINNILVYVDSDNNVYKIELDFTSYMVSINEFNKYHLTLYYGASE